MYWVPPSHQSGAWRRANRRGVEIIQDDSFSRQFVQIRCWNLGTSMETDVIETLRGDKHENSYYAQGEKKWLQFFLTRIDLSLFNQHGMYPLVDSIHLVLRIWK